MESVSGLGLGSDQVSQVLLPVVTTETKELIVEPVSSWVELLKASATAEVLTTVSSKN